MKNQEKVINFTIFSIIFVAVLGTILHFTFKWSNCNLLIGAFSAVNESTWEHLKLLFFPMLITTILGYFYIGKDLSSFLCARVFGIISAILFTIIFFFTYTGILGRNIAFLNILTFYVAVIIGEYISYRVMSSNLNCNTSTAIWALALLFFCFVFFTYFPPEIGLFLDPLTAKYGIIQNYY